VIYDTFTQSTMSTVHTVQEQCTIKQTALVTCNQ